MPITTLYTKDFRPRTFQAAADEVRRRLPLPRRIFNKLSDVAKDRAFTLIESERVDVIRKCQTMIEAAVKSGQGTPDLMRELTGYLKEQGVSVESLPRLRQKVNHELLASYSETRREVLNTPTMLGFFPYRQWFTVGNGVPGINGVRPTHAILHAKVFAADDDLWVYCHPPEWDWGCRCLYRALTAIQVREMRAIVWTYIGGLVVPSPAQLLGQVGEVQARGYPIQGTRDVADQRTEFDLTGLGDELREAVEGALKG